MTTTSQAADNAMLARRFVEAVESGATGERLRAFVHDDVEQLELPNRLFPEGARRDLAALLSSAEKGQKVLRSQRYEILNLVASGRHVAIEMTWRGELAVPVGSKKPGEALTGRFAFFLDIDDGRIRSMRNYDCYDAF